MGNMNCGDCIYFKPYNNPNGFGDCDKKKGTTHSVCERCSEFSYKPTHFDLPLEAIEMEQGRHATNIPECFQMDESNMAQFADEIFSVIRKIADTIERESDMWVICEMAKKYLTGIVELDRLQSLEYHGDTYETDDFCFAYHEMNGIQTVSIIRKENMTHYSSATLPHPMNHTEFVKWCNTRARTIPKTDESAKSGTTRKSPFADDIQKGDPNNG